MLSFTSRHDNILLKSRKRGWEPKLFARKNTNGVVCASKNVREATTQLGSQTEESYPRVHNIFKNSPSLEPSTRFRGVYVAGKNPNPYKHGNESGKFHW